MVQAEVSKGQLGGQKTINYRLPTLPQVKLFERHKDK